MLYIDRQSRASDLTISALRLLAVMLTKIPDEFMYAMPGGRLAYPPALDAGKLDKIRQKLFPDPLNLRELGDIQAQPVCLWAGLILEPVMQVSVAGWRNCAGQATHYRRTGGAGGLRGFGEATGTSQFMWFTFFRVAGEPCVVKHAMISLFRNAVVSRGRTHLDAWNKLAVRSVRQAEARLAKKLKPVKVTDEFKLKPMDPLLHFFIPEARPRPAQPVHLLESDARKSIIENFHNRAKLIPVSDLRKNFLDLSRAAI